MSTLPMSQSLIFSTKAIKLVSVKQYGPSLKLNISNEAVNQSSSISSDEYNIHNVVNVVFKASLQSSYTGSGTQKKSFAYDIAVKKLISAKDMTVLLRIACIEATFTKEKIICTENWCNWIPIGTIINNSFMVDLKVTLSKIQSHIATKLYNDDMFTDFTLNGEDGSVVVHKAHLAAHSDTFMTMFQGEWKETKQSYIDLKGVTLQTLKHFKEYIYLSTLPKNNEDLRALLLFAMQYLIDSLKAECTLRLLETITAENLDSLIEFCAENKIHELLRVIQETTPETVLATGYAIRIKKRMASVTEVVDNKGTEDENREDKTNGGKKDHQPDT